VTDTYTYDAFGNLLNRSGATENDYLYTGEQYDPNVGFYYLRARYYNQANGRFLTMDTYQGSVFEPASLHKYLYCGADPVNSWDPSGEFKGLFLGAVAAIMIISILAHYITFRLSVPMGNKPYIWDGHIIVISYGKHVGIGLIVGYFETKYGNAKLGDGSYLIVMSGVTESITSAVGTLTTASLETPEMVGPVPYALLGGVGWVSAAIQQSGGGFSVTPYFKMGLGKERGKSFSFVLGYGTGVDAMSGISLPFGPMNLYNESPSIPWYSSGGAGATRGL